MGRVTCNPAARAVLSSLLLYLTDREDAAPGPLAARRAEGKANRAPEPQDAQRRPTRFQLLQARFMGSGREPRLKRIPNPGIEPRSSALQADSLPSEPPGKPKNTGVGNLSLLQRIFLTQES